MAGFLTIGYCFPYCFLEIFVGDKALMEGDKVVMGDPPVPPTRENPGFKVSETLKGVSNTLQNLEFVKLRVDEILEGSAHSPPGIKCRSEIAWYRKG